MRAVDDDDDEGSRGPGTLIVLGVTMPPWPGPDEAELVDGCPDWAAGR